jgi:hypothetical protein
MVRGARRVERTEEKKWEQGWQKKGGIAAALSCSTGTEMRNPSEDVQGTEIVK